MWSCKKGLCPSGSSEHSHGPKPRAFYWGWSGTLGRKPRLTPFQEALGVPCQTSLLRHNMVWRWCFRCAVGELALPWRCGGAQNAKVSSRKTSHFQSTLRTRVTATVGVLLRTVEWLAASSGHWITQVWMVFASGGRYATHSVKIYFFSENNTSDERRTSLNVVQTS